MLRLGEALERGADSQLGRVAVAGFTLERRCSHEAFALEAPGSRQGPPVLRGSPASAAMGRAMTVRIHVPGPLRACCGGVSELVLSAPSVRAALEQIERRHPSLYRSICDETGTVRRHVNLFVNTSNVRDRDGLDTPLVPGDIITILPAVSGG